MVSKTKILFHNIAGLLTVAQLKSLTLVSVSISLLMISLLWCAIAVLPPPTTVTSVTVRSEILEFEVANDKEVAFNGSGLKFVSPSVEGCVTGLVRPKLKTKVTYFNLDGQFGISLDGNHENKLLALVDIDNKTTSVSYPFSLVEDVKKCGGIKFRRWFPVWGAGSVGGLLSFQRDRASGTLLQGEVDIYSRSIYLPFFSKGGTLYQTIDRPIKLAAGTMLKTAAPLPGRPPSAFRGIVVREGKWLSINLSTEADLLELYNPGFRGADLLQVDFTTRLFKDPTILKIQGFLLTLFLILPVTIGLVSPLFTTKGGSQKNA